MSPKASVRRDSSAAELEQHGIVRVTTERFDGGGYKYDRLPDAIAEAERRWWAAGFPS